MKLVISLTASVFLLLFIVGCNKYSDTTNEETTLTPMTAEVASRTLGTINSLELSTLTSALTQALSTVELSSRSVNFTPFITEDDNASRIPYSVTRQCPVSGSVHIDGWITLLKDFNVTNTYSECETLDGIFVNGTNRSFGHLKGSQLLVDTSENKITVTKGTMKYYFYSEISMVFDYAKLTSTITFNGLNSILEFFDNSMLEHPITFHNFHVTQYFSDKSLSISGEIEIYLQSCIDNYIDIQTQEPLVPQDGIFTSGTLLINDAVYEFLEDGSVNINLPDELNLNMAQGVEAICPSEFYFVD